MPFRNISPLLESFATRFRLHLSNVQHRSTVEAMNRELDAIAELQAAEAGIVEENCTLGFDATTQEGVHVNSVHVTTKSACYSVAVDELPGVTAADYHQHITLSIILLLLIARSLVQIIVAPETLQGTFHSLTDRCF